MKNIILSGRRPRNVLVFLYSCYIDTVISRNVYLEHESKFCKLLYELQLFSSQLHILHVRRYYMKGIRDIEEREKLFLLSKS